MKTFDQTKKGKKVKEKKGEEEKSGGNGNKPPPDSPTKNEDDDPDAKAVAEARKKKKDQLRKSQTSGKKDTNHSLFETVKDEKEVKQRTTWVEVNDKISKKDMDKIDLSTNKGGFIDLEKEKNKYLGGDDDVLEGFYNSDDEIEFENFKKNKNNKKQGGGLFTRLTGAFQNLTGNKTLTEEDLEPVLK